MAGKQQRSWLIVYTEEAVVDFAEVKAREERKAFFNAVHKLKELGPDLLTPHMKSLKGEADLFELRPKQGRSAVRPIYCRSGQQFLILAIAPNKDAFDRAVADANVRKAKYLRARGR